jgi:hypothetical protein
MHLELLVIKLRIAKEAGDSLECFIEGALEINVSIKRTNKPLYGLPSTKLDLFLRTGVNLEIPKHAQGIFHEVTA